MPQPARSPDAVERLYVYTLVVALLLVLLVVLLAFIARGQFVQQRDALERLTQRVYELEAAQDQVGARDTRPPATRPAATRPAAGANAASPAGPLATGNSNSAAPRTSSTAATAGNANASTVSSPPAASNANAARPAPTPSGSAGSGDPAGASSAATGAPRTPDSGATADAAEAPSDAVVAALLDRLMASDGESWTVRDSDAGRRELARLRAVAREASWSGATYARLALLARLLGSELDAGLMLTRALERGDAAPDFFDHLVRERLAAGAIGEALAAAERFADASDDSPLAMLLLAEIFLAQENVAAAADVTPAPADAVRFTTGQRLRLGRAYVLTGQMAVLATLVNLIDRAPPAHPPLAVQRDFLMAVALLHNDRAAEALTLLDAAAAARPGDCLIDAYRGAALLRTRQVAAAREALARLTEAQPGCPQGWYWRGVVEAGHGRLEDAAAAFDAALAASARFAPAWEARGSLALGRGELTAALESLARAAELEPRRATAHFLIAIAHAKASRPEQTAAALRVLFAIDPSYVDRALQADVIRKMFGADELAALRDGPPAEAMEEAPTTAPSATTGESAESP
ncbi:MAG: tetratricopeptide repeat protein [Planctomycetia bacterium]|nr:MAG: tetratricopeptide repeat protein [Planctomycetia bacterium]